MANKKTAENAALGESARVAASHRRKSNPKYAELEKKFEVALAIADLAILHRTRAKITQQQLALRMGTSVSAISRLESGLHIPSMETLRKLAEALGGRVKIDIVEDEAQKGRSRSRSRLRA